MATVREFLAYLKEERGNGDSTRNQRLAAIHSLFRFMARETPELVSLSTQVNEVPTRKTVTRTIPYLEKDEIEAVLRAPDRKTAQGRREHALMLFLYNTGARADEAAQLAVGSVEMGSSPFARILGKGKKERLCPLWPQTVKIIREMLEERPFLSAQSRVFLNARQKPITRFGIRGVVKRLVARAAQSAPSLKTKRISTHGIRHTTAVHLLRAGVDINTIRAWLGHVSLDTTNKYTEVDLKMKAEALQTTSIPVPHAESAWGDKRKSLMVFLASLARPSGIM